MSAHRYWHANPCGTQSMAHQGNDAHPLTHHTTQPTHIIAHKAAMICTLARNSVNCFQSHRHPTKWSRTEQAHS